MNLLEINRACVNYNIGYKNISAIKNINLHIKEGEYICIIGNNGSGKSTLIKSILSLVKLNSGGIKINCKKNEISYLPQNNAIFNDFPATVKEIILSGTQQTGFCFPFYKKEDHNLANLAIKSTKLEALVGRRFGELSGGQQQRVLLARAICKKPKLLVLDEPCTGLDESVSKNFYNLIYKLNKENKTSIIMVTHDMDKALNYANRIIKLNKEILFDGNISNFLKYKAGGEIA